MDNLVELLQTLNFTKYEAQTLNTLISYHSLSAAKLHEYSGVPQPKIYNTMIKLQDRGLIDIIPKGMGKKKIFKVKSQGEIRRKILEYTEQIQNLGNKSVSLIDELYNTEETDEIPFIGIAGNESIKDNVSSLIETAKESIEICLPLEYLDFNLIKKRVHDINIKVIFIDEEAADKNANKLPGVEIYKIKSGAFDLISNFFMQSIKKYVPSDAKDSFGIQVFQKILLNLRDMFGIMVVDRKKSLFKVPQPIETPIAIIATLKDIVEFHCKGIDSIIEGSILLKK